jgi:phosphatidylglycerophosphatase C
VFDFDNTLVRGDSGTMFAVSLICEHPLRMLLALLFAPFALPLFVGEKTRRYGISAFYWAATVGRSQPQFERRVREFAIKYLSEPRVYVEAMRALEEHQRKGEPIVVATGCFEALARAILQDGLGLEAEVVGSELRQLFGGRVFREHCFGANKLHMVERRIGVRELAFAYSDSSFDLELLLAAKQRFLVNASSATTRLLQKHAEECETLTWRELVPLAELQKRGNVSV